MIIKVLASLPFKVGHAFIGKSRTRITTSTLPPRNKAHTPKKNMEFTVFCNLPVELRLMIWERVPQPRRLVGQVACPNCYCPASQRGLPASKRQACQARHKDRNLRFVAQPRKQAVFPPLQACRESRAVWLRRYRATPRYITGNLLDGVEASAYRQRFDVPFVSYEADIFTIFRPLDWIGLGHVPNVPDARNAWFDPFMGLDRSQIRHVAVGEDAEMVGISAGALDLRSLTSLETLWVLSFGPGPEFRRDGAQVEMTPEEALDLECGILQVPERAVGVHPLFNAARLGHRRFSPRLHVRPLRCYLEMLKAWLWHAEHSVLGGAEQVLGQDMFMFEDFILGDAGEDANAPDASSRCPLVGITGCGPSGHTRGDMMTWVPRFEMHHLMLYDKSSWIRDEIFEEGRHEGNVG
jgi:hypothetical protein